MYRSVIKCLLVNCNKFACLLSVYWLLNLKPICTGFIYSICYGVPASCYEYKIFTVLNVYRYTQQNTLDHVVNVVSYAYFSMSKRKVTFEDGDGEITLEDVPKKKVGLI